MSSGYRYELYGLTLRSPLVLPCPRVDRYRKVDVFLTPGSGARFARIRAGIATGDTDSGDDRFWCKRLPDGTMYLRWPGLFEFLVSPDGRQIWYRALEEGTLESFNAYLLGPILSFSLLALGIEPLHGTATVIDGKAVVFLGGPGWGKSTLSAALLARGHRVLTDDLVVVAPRDTRWVVHAGIPRLKLFPSVAHRLLRTEVRAPRMNPGTSKLVLSVGTGQACHDVVPVKALYVLPQPTKRGTPEGSHVGIESLSGRDAFLEIIGAAFNLVVLERERFANQFTFATRLTAGVPVRRLTYPRRLSALPAVCDALVADVVASGSGYSQ